MDLQPASSLLSPLSRVLIHTENQFHLTEPISLPVLIYGQDHDFGSLKKVEEDEKKSGGGGWDGSSRGLLGNGENAELGAPWGPFGTVHGLGRPEGL